MTGVTPGGMPDRRRARMPPLVVAVIGAAGAMLVACGAGSAGTTTTRSAPAPAQPQTTPAGPSGNVAIATFSGNSDVTTTPFRVDTTAWTLQYAVDASQCKTASVVILAYDNSHPGAFVRNLPVSGCGTGVATIPFGPSAFYLKVTVSAKSVTYVIDVSEVR